MDSVIKLISQSLSEISPTGQIVSLKKDGDTAVLVVNCEGQQRINITYMEPSEYPRSSVLLLAEGNDTLADKLARISERFQDNGPLTAVLAKICDSLDIPVNEEALRSAEGKNDRSGMHEVGSEAMSEDGSDYPGSDAASSDYGDVGDDEQEDKELVIECGQRQGRWQRHEEELERMQCSAQVLSMEQGKASKRQIFSSKEAFNMLVNELLGFIRRQYEGGAHVSADSAGDDVYTWNVEMWKSAFRPDCQLAKDMQEVSVKWAVSSIQLRFTFMRGLHPFYPPRLEVVRPHLSAPLPGVLSSLPLLRLEHWDPLMNMSQLLDKIKEFLEEFGRVDVSHPRNSQAAYPSSAFSPVQVYLARLEALVDVKPACYSQHAALYEARSTRGRSEAPADATQQIKKQRTDEAAATGTAGGAAAAPAAGAPAAAAPAAAAPAAGAAGAAGAGAPAAGAAGAAAASGAAAAGNVVWARGTGYGYGRQPGGAVWDAKAAAAAQEAQDEQLCGILQGLAAALREELRGAGEEPSAAEDDAPALPGQQQQQQAADGDDPMDVGLSPEQQECLAAVQGSVLLPMLAREFSTVAFPEMVTRHQYYTPLLAVLQALCRQPTVQLLALNMTAQEQPAAGGSGSTSSGQQQQQQQQQVLSIAGAVRGLVKGATMFKERMAKVLEEQRKSASTTAAASSSSASAAKPKVDKQTEALVQEAERSMTIADQLLLVHSKLQHLTIAEDSAAAAAAAGEASGNAAAAGGGQRGARTRRATRSIAAAAGQPAAAAAAAGAGAPAAAASYETALKPLVLDSARISNRHKFASEAAKDPMGLKARVQKVTSEMAGIERLIVVSESSSIFVRVDDDNSFLWKVLITGPEDTPYGGGAFVFDVFFPPNYPQVPPKVLLVTTGGGSVRFNPNLYNCGKVCLSLLGTWQGDKGEGWNPEVSSAFQVLVSIQSLILVPEPYFNEPGYEQRGNMEQSKAYNRGIREATIKWAMIDQLQHPPPEFADVIKAHFKLRGPAICKQIQGWIDEAKGAAATHASTLTALKTTFESELAKLA